jgi:hypothetical protein
MTKMQNYIFYLGYLHTELLRVRRAEATSAAEKMLLCENLFFRFNDEDVVDGKTMLDWPHWALKLLYTKAGVLFGKFWKGEREFSRSGAPIPPPPYHLLSIRSGIKERDAAFFKKAQFLLEDFTAAHDTGLSVVPELSCANQPQHCANVFCEKPTLSLANALTRPLQSSGLYEYALSLGENKI